MSTERPSALTCYKASVIQGLPEGVAPGLREQRQRVSQQLWNGQQQLALQYADEFLLEAVTDDETTGLPTELFQDNSTHPLIHWWWHLGKLRAGTYPAHLLPAHLRAIYQPEQRLAA
ncbi:MAG: hypothetical protein QG599_1886 [Pseudomonadota bacterium]|nr:hypothetical protein [Pseudomonadota bacterium]